ncbi:MAG: YXWGXW repeat-containing protein [Devosia sp.]|nr:YXWGXW repeat-containing protein [Devosia sp.]
MKYFQGIRAAALMSISVAALSLAACNKNGSAQNGAYVAGSTDSSAPASSQLLPPSGEYQAVANTPPPPLPVYDQPPIPGRGYVWTPGYWAWSDRADDYYWVPGTWVRPPHIGRYWTPGYWRYYDGRYLYSDGYWGLQVGFYGGVNYGYGYYGDGYVGGRWQGNQFYYNSQANNLGSRRIGAVYSQGVSSSGNRVSFNGGPGGLRTAPVQAEIAANQAGRAPPTRVQRDQAQLASTRSELRASVNRGAPPIAATARPGTFRGAGVVPANRASATYSPPAALGNQRPARQQNQQQAQPRQQQAGPQQQAQPQQKARPQQQAQPRQQQARPQQQAQPQQRARPQQQAQPRQQQARPQQQAQPRQQQARPRQQVQPQQKARPQQQVQPRQQQARPDKHD